MSMKISDSIRKEQPENGKAEGERLRPCRDEQRWEAVFRRERKPASFDRPHFNDSRESLSNSRGSDAVNTDAVSLQTKFEGV